MTDQSSSSSPLQTERGSTSISDSVVSKVAGIASQEVEGIRMGSGASQAVGGIRAPSPVAGPQTQGVSVEVGQEEAALDLTLTAEYGKSIPQLAEAVRRNVINRVEPHRPAGDRGEHNGCQRVLPAAGAGAAAPARARAAAPGAGGAATAAGPVRLCPPEGQADLG